MSHSHDYEGTDSCIKVETCGAAPQSKWNRALMRPEDDSYIHQKFSLYVKTRDIMFAGTDSNVYCILVDGKLQKSQKIKLDNFLHNDLERGSTDVYSVKNKNQIGSVESIEIWRDDRGLNDSWFLEEIIIKQEGDELAKNKSPRESQKSNGHFNDCLPFPCHRWIKAKKVYTLYLYSFDLPETKYHTPLQRKQRVEEIDENRISYQYEDALTGIPRRIKELPTRENFSDTYKWDITEKKLKLKGEATIQKILGSSGKWKSIEDMLQLYKGTFGVPKGYHSWDSDESFGLQRLNGCNTRQLRRCMEIPSNFAVTNEMVGPFLEGHSLDDVIKQQRLFIINLAILEGISSTGKNKLCTPMALFYAHKETGKLMPIAIQLYQEPSAENPVFLPSDPKYTWMLAKMFMNNADCAVHQSCMHLGFTHLVCESICIAAKRSLSPSHPVHQLLAPHFLYVLAINELAVNKLLSKGGWIDKSMTFGAAGVGEVLKKLWVNWRLDVDAWLPADLEERGVNDKDILPMYYCRDDQLLLHEAIVNYVTDVLEHVYDSKEKLPEDHEIQQFAKLLVDKDVGAGIQGVFGGGKFENLSDVINTVAAVIYIASVGHAAANFCQYDEYAFPANYPAKLYGDIPTDKKPRTEADIIAHLPDKDTTFDVMIVTKLLSDKGTNALADFEIQYIYSPKGVDAVKRFKTALAEIQKKIEERNKTLKEPYTYLEPKNIPNAISI